MAPIRTGTPFVGRAVQFGRLIELLEASANGAAAAVLVAGDAGVGKTRLTDEVAAAAADRGHLVLVGHCVDLGAGGLPYLPFVEALRGTSDPRSGPSAAAAAEVIRRIVAELPVLGRLAGRVNSGAEDGMDRLPLFEAVSALLGALGREAAPVLLVLEDLHWADPSTRDLLRFLMSRLATDRLLIHATYRSDDLHRRHPLRPLLAELVRLPRVERFDLPAFDEPELRQFLRAMNGAPLPEPVVGEIWGRSEGNAYYAEELLAARELGSSGLPLALADVLLARVERLPAAAQQITRVASVAGRRVGDALLRSVSELAPDEADVALRDAVTHHVLVPDGEDRVAFRHALLQEAVYGDLLPGERVRWHARYAAALRAEGNPALAANLAHHSLASHDLPGALQALLQAAEDAECRLAPAQALALYEEALQIWDGVPDQSRPEGAGELDLTLRAARMAGRAGELDRAVSLSRAAVRLAQRGGDTGQEARARGQLAADLYAVERNDDCLAEANAVQALLTGEPPSSTWVWAATIAARVAGSRRDAEALARIRSEALPVARQLGLISAEVDLMISSSFVAAREGDYSAVQEELTQAHRLALQADDQQSALRAAFNLAGLKIDLGDLAGGAAGIRAALAAAAEAGLAWSAYGLECRGQLINVLEISGAWDEALEQATSARMHSPVSQRPRFLDPVLPILVSRDPETGLAAADEDDPTREEHQGYAHLVFGARADALTWLGRTEEAHAGIVAALAHLAAVTDDEEHLGGLYLCALGLAALADEAERARARGDGQAEDEARAAGRFLLRRLVEIREGGQAKLGVLGPEGLAWYARGEAEAGRLAGEQDPQRWAAVVEAFGFGHRYETARSRWRLAAALAAHGDRSAAGVQARLARSEADALGARPLRDAVDALARRARLDLGSGPVEATVLTPREQEVIRLVAAGLTNRQIGRRLRIAEKTASVHVSNILTKLGASGRTEAVGIAHRRGLVALTDSEPEHGAGQGVLRRVT